MQDASTLITVEVVQFESSRYSTAYRAPLVGRRAKVWWKDPDFRTNAFYFLRVTQEVAPDIAARYGRLPVNSFPTEMAWNSRAWMEQN